MKNTLDGINRLCEAENQISDLEEKVAENIQTQHQKQNKNFRSEDSVSDFENMKCKSIICT